MTIPKTSSITSRRPRRLSRALALAAGGAALTVSLLGPSGAVADEGHPPATVTPSTATQSAPANEENQPHGHAETDADHDDALRQDAATAAPSAQPATAAPPHNDAEGHAQDHDDGEAHSNNYAHDAVDAEAHANDDGHDEAAEDEEAHGHGDEAPAISVQTKQAVLGTFAGVNGLAVVTAAVRRRRTPPKLPKHHQR